MAVQRDGKALPWAEPGSQTEDFGGQATSEELTVFLTQLPPAAESDIGGQRVG